LKLETGVLDLLRSASRGRCRKEWKTIKIIKNQKRGGLMLAPMNRGSFSCLVGDDLFDKVGLEQSEDESLCRGFGT
jgi:hypothetical protein